MGDHPWKRKRVFPGTTVLESINNFDAVLEEHKIKRSRAITGTEYMQLTSVHRRTEKKVVDAGLD